MSVVKSVRQTGRGRKALLARLHPRILFVLTIVAYVALFNWTYKTLVAPRYDFWGLSYNQVPDGYIFVSWLVAIIPALWMPLRFKRPSLLLFCFQYIVMYIPAVFILYHTSLPELKPQEAFMLVMLMFCGLSIIQSVYYVPLVSFKITKLPASGWWALFFVGMASLLGYIIVILGGNFRLANLQEIYDVRTMAAETVAATGSRFGLYAIMWSAGFFLPFCFALGAYARRWWLLAVFALGYLVLFGIGGAKTTLFAFVYFPMVYLWLTRTGKNTPSVFVVGIGLLLAMGALLDFIVPSVGFWYIAVVNFRTFGVPQLLIAQYFDFFRHNPLTYMSHVNGVNLFVQYPYDQDIARNVGAYCYGVPVGSNAGLWAGDGITGFGPIGIVIISIVCAVVFWIFDCTARRYNPRFVALAATFIAITFSNGPLSTTLLSGGWIILMVTLCVLPNKGLLRCAFKEESVQGLTYSGGQPRIWKVGRHRDAPSDKTALS